MKGERKIGPVCFVYVCVRMWVGVCAYMLGGGLCARE